ncbi:hemerythrin domain-containing protein [Streptomyces sp. Y1]|uniref:Hemerythrin domain-containing protein n=1 Tax=Streptomyces sp. Y1 TaxID=3238634 RepID=A0AB39TVQ3_9ACTN
MNGPEAFPSELCAEHRAMETVLRRLAGIRADSGPGPDDDLRLLHALRELLDRHHTVEEEYLHPLVRRYLPAGGALADAAVHTHTTIRLLTDRALDRRLPPGERHHAIDTLLLVLRAHLRGEEDRLFPALRLRAPAEELRRCSRRVREAPPRNPPRPVWGLPPGTGAIAAVRDHLTGHDSGENGRSP